MIDTITEQVLTYAPKLAYATIVVILGFIITSIILKVTKHVMTNRNVEATAKDFLLNIFSWILKIAVLISAISILGIQMTSFVVVLGAFAFAVGLALQGSLSNFAGGVLILLFKLFKSGDFIEAQGQMGTVERIEIFHTVMKSPQNQQLIVPNGQLANGIIKNFSANPTRRVDFTFGISYESDFEKAKKIVTKIIEKDERVLTDQDVFIRVTELADSSVNISARAWTKKEDFWGFFVDTTETVKKEFDKKGIDIPYPTQTHYLKK